MARAPLPHYKRRKEPVVDHLIRASIDNANGVYDENGHYATLVYAGCPTYERAKEIEQALYRCALYMHKYKILDVSMKANIVKQANGEYSVEYRAIDKTHARAYMLNHYGDDRSKWAYDPRAKNKKD